MGDSSRYQLKDTLGRGGMGVIFRAYDTLMRRDVALKTVLDAQDKSARELFFREWGVQASITHPNIAEIYDIGEMQFEGQTRPYFVMPLLRGAPLADLLRDRGHSPSPERLVPILLQACRGLQAAHERQLIHRDLKPSNIFVLEDDSVKLIDFGIAHLGDTTHTSIRGTLAYMAPELLDGKPATRASDIFAMGVVSYEALTGRRPFSGADDAALAHSIRTATPPLPSEIDPRAAGDLSRVIFRAMAKQPWQRYQDVREFADFLDRAFRGEVIELFDPARVQPRVDKALRAFERGDYSLATDIVGELEGEGNVDAEIVSLRRQIEQARRGVQIRTYLESARRLLEEQEHSLALRKVQEALELDAANSDALALKSEIEKLRRARTAEDWFALARRHLDNSAFSQARSVLNNLLEVKPDDEAVQQLRAELERREADDARLKNEKDRLQREARGAWDRGEVTVAMSNLERWMELDRSTPETDASRIASVRNLFVTVRTEHESIRNGYEQARALLEAGKFDEASDLCRLFLSKYPSHALFQSVQFDVEERRRQALSAFIAETDQRASAETDLDRRVAILEEAARRFPAESHFQRALEPARAKRDLVNSIVARAHLFEEQGKLTEALEQWELLGPVHGAYPGLEYEKDRVRKRRQAQARTDAKTAWIEQVDAMLAQGDYERAMAAAARAAAEFPGDPEMEELHRASATRLEAGRRAAALIAEARALLASGAPAQAAARLREALAADDRNAVARPLLARTLAEQAQAAIDNGEPDSAASALLDEAATCEPRNAQVANLRAALADRQRERAVSEAMAEARRLFNEKNLAGALDACRRALALYPNEVRLRQLTANLEAAVERERQSPPPVAADPAPQTPPPPAPPPTPEQTAPAAPPAPPAPPASAPMPAAARMPRRWWFQAVAAIVACLAVVGAARQFLQRTPAPEATPRPAASAPPPPAAAPAATVQTLAFGFTSEWEGATLTLNGAAVPGEGMTLQAGAYRMEFRSPDGKAAASAAFTVDAAGRASVATDPQSSGLRLLLVDRRKDGLQIHAPAGVDVSVDGAPGTYAAAGFEGHRIESRHQGEEARAITLPVLSAPTLQAFVLRPGKPDFGTIVISSNVDDLQVRIDSYVIPFKVKNGMSLPRIPAGDHRVVVKREGYDQPAPYSVAVKPGEDVVLKLQLKPSEVDYSAAGLPAGATLLVDGHAIEVSADGTVRGKLPPGPHTFELQKGASHSRTVSKTLQPGAPLVLAAAELALIPATGTLAVDVTPAGAALTLRKDGEATARPINAPATLAEGNYIVGASAPGFSPLETRIAIQAGRTSTAMLRLSALAARKEPSPAPDTPTSDAALKLPPGWREDGVWLVRRGGGFTQLGTLRPGAPVSFQAAVRDGKRLQWVISTGKDSLLFKLERKKFIQILVEGGRQRTVAEVPVNIDLKAGVNVRISLSGNRVAHSIGAAPAEMDVPAAFAAGGAWGFTIPGGDEFAVKELRGR